MADNTLLYRIALSNTPGIGDINARKLIDHLGSAEAIFSEPGRNLLKIPGIGSKLAGYLSSREFIDRAKREIEFIKRHDIRVAWFKDDDYPPRLKQCEDSPILIFYKGDLNLGSKHVLSIIGTRNATRRGRDICNSIISALAARHPDLTIISGLAYGIDITAHKAAIKNNIPTIGIMAHGFGTLYPSVHTQVAREMLKQGGLITDFLSDEPPDRNNFLKRNRIIAGISDATLVVESGSKGGAMVTADIAVSYNRDLFAVPGFPGEKYSEGCNLLIKSNRASLVEKAEDIEYFMDWKNEQPREVQQSLFSELTSLEADIYNLLLQYEHLSADQISEKLTIPVQRLSSALLSLQFSGHIALMPGNSYRKRHHSNIII